MKGQLQDGRFSKRETHNEASLSPDKGGCACFLSQLSLSWNVGLLYPAQKARSREWRERRGKAFERGEWAKKTHLETAEPARVGCPGRKEDEPRMVPVTF